MAVEQPPDVSPVRDLNGYAEMRARLLGRFEDVKDDLARGGWTALCPVCPMDAPTRFFLDRSMKIETCTAGHTASVIAAMVIAEVQTREPGEDDDVPAGLKQYALTVTIAELRAEPPRREYLLTVASTGVGVLARGQVGMIAARGGTGKSNALMQLGVAVATGDTWFGAGRGWAAKRGRALMLFAEEDADEVRRRRYYALKAAGIVSEEDLALVAQNMVLMPMRGLGVSLTTEVSKGFLPITERATQIRTYLEEEAQAGRPFTMVGLDPLARFAGADVEVDNFAATKFVEVCETLTSKDCGIPNITLAHHSRKLVINGADPESADSIRGPTGLVDAVRWAAVMTRKKKSKLISFRVVKTNYAAEPEPLVLAKVDGCHGALEAVEGEQEDINEPQPVDHELMELVFKQVMVKPASGNELARQLRRKVEAVQQACADLEQASRIARKGRVWAPN